MAIINEGVYGKKGEKPISQEVPVPDVEKKEQYNMNRRTFLKIGAGLAAAFVTEEATIGALRKYLLGETSGSQTGAGAPSDPHVEEATFGGYNIKGETEGYGFKVDNPYGMGITPGGKAEIVGIIENGKGIVYFDADAAEGADMRVAKTENSIFPDTVPGTGLFKFELNLAELKEKYGLGSGEGILVSNAQAKSFPGVEFVIS